MLLTFTVVVHYRACAQEPAPGAAQQLAEAQQRIKKLSATEYDLDGIRINAATRAVRIPAVVNLKEAPIEYALVHDMGKTHESILVTAINPISIQVALLLASYKPGTTGLLNHVPVEDKIGWNEKAPEQPGANRVKVVVEWKKDGKDVSAHLSDMVQNIEKRQVPPDLGTWIFNGSHIDERGFVAQHDGSIIAVWLDRNAIFNSPATGNWRDDLWISMPANIPEVGTPVTLVLTPEVAAKPPAKP